MPLFRRIFYLTNHDGVFILIYNLSFGGTTNMELTREQALALLKKYNRESFHILHALTGEGVMRWYA